ncbi:hypothetical protein PNK_0529 [Candidatus Protochlamydia naegleriophila]|uniref:Uncharacterized protein n=1 Tax=Candidatus Protochlamydia naegleriophila TaxID=389348 RepID=A0A0U5JAQ6_9BACT|nr:hypothetical protein [Candidatus Protochlamydia naegleriophila]CUI16157.1 hypothetical protein PNK_0529 [Candidatus Protochlamydia naegleriophila]
MINYGVLEQFQQSLWNVSTLQFSLQVPDLERAKWKKVEMFARTAFAVVVALYVSHAWHPFLSKRVAEGMRDALVIWLSAFATSLLLKGIHHGVQLQGNATEGEESTDVDLPGFHTPVSNVSCPGRAGRPIFSHLKGEEESWDGDVFSSDESSEFESDSETLNTIPERYKKDVWNSHVCRNLLSEFEASLDDKEQDDA